MTTTELPTAGELRRHFFAVIFTSERTGQDVAGYAVAAARMLELAPWQRNAWFARIVEK